MARFDQLMVYNTMLAGGLVPLFCHADPETARKVVDAIARGGVHPWTRVMGLQSRG